jgi:hypothetical protein
MRGFHGRKRPRKGGARTHLRWIVRIGYSSERECSRDGPVRKFRRTAAKLNLSIYFNLS